MKQVSTSLNVFLLALVILLSSPALAAEEKHVIVTAEVDVDAGLITLFGDFSDEFGEKPLVVTLNGVELSLLNVFLDEIMLDEIMAILPPDILPGTHRVAVCTVEDGEHGDSDGDYEEDDSDDDDRPELCPDFDDHQDFNELDVTIGAGGPQGPPGADGADGPPGISGLQRIVASDLNNVGPDPPLERTLNVSCPPNTKILGGGCKCQKANSVTEPPFYSGGAVILASFPNTDTSWECVCTKAGGGAVLLEAYALCGESQD